MTSPGGDLKKIDDGAKKAAITVPLPLKGGSCFVSAVELRDLALLAKDFTLMNGALMRTASSPDSSDVVSHVPFLLFPSPFPRRLFNLVWSLQEDFHTLIHRMALNPTFLHSSLKLIIETDSFTHRLWNLYNEVYSEEERHKQRIYIGTTRNDYMLHKPKGSSSQDDLEIKQVEYNLTAISFAPLQVGVSNWHRFLVGRLLGRDTSPLDMTNGQPNRPDQGFGALAVEALKAYKKIYSPDDARILIVADSPARNIFDQRGVELAMLAADPTVKTIRRTMAQLRSAIDLDEVDRTGRLVVEGHEIGVVYSRTGYNASDYDFEAGDWELVRRPIERSRAAKTPCIAHQLVNYKKIQQILATPGILQQYGVEADVADRMGQTFTELRGLDFNEAGDEAIELGITNYDDYVLKPMQEGGGHNYFGSEVAKFLKSIRDSPERQNYILMGYIRPPTYENVSIAAGESADEPRFHRFNSELGIYGGFVVADDKTVYNKAIGCLLRSKREDVNESGVAAGFGRIDSAYFVD